MARSSRIWVPLGWALLSADQVGPPWSPSVCLSMPRMRRTQRHWAQPWLASCWWLGFLRRGFVLEATVHM